MILEDLRSPPLKRVLPEIAEQPLAARLAVAREICEAIARVHDRGVVHADLSMDNILVDLALRRIGVVDFGVAASPGELLAPLTTLAFAAPERPLAGCEPAFGDTPPESTLFTMSEFSRTLVENPGGGTDHGWGNHMIVLGNRVNGRRIFGEFPDLGLDTTTSSTDAGSRRRPSISTSWAWRTGLVRRGPSSRAFSRVRHRIVQLRSSEVWARPTRGSSIRSSSYEHRTSGAPTLRIGGKPPPDRRRLRRFTPNP